MPEDASLDEFLDAGDTETGGAEVEGDTTDTATGDDDAEDVSDDDGGDGERVAPATTIYAWSPDAEACAECGTVASRRWEQGGALVCPDCKDWDR